MKKLLSTRYSAGAFNTAMLVLRLGFGILMMLHGYDKLVHFGTLKDQFMSFLGLGSAMSLALCVFAEFFCALFVVIGLFTRFATIPIIINMVVAIYKIHDMHVVSNVHIPDWKGEPAMLYLTGFVVLLLVGPGKVSVDAMIGK